MNNKNKQSNTRGQIFAYIQRLEMVRPADIDAHFSINRQMVHRHLKSLIEAGKIKRIGSAPRVFYTVINQDAKATTCQLEAEIEAVVNQEFFFIEPTGKELSGVEGFVLWCQKRNFSVEKKALEFTQIINKYQRQKSRGLLDASHKMRKTFADDCYVDQVFYFDFYAVEVFGKTKMGQKLLYAKQGQDRVKIKAIALSIKQPIIQLISSYTIDSVVFVPPTVPRTVQFMKVLEAELALSLASIKVLKVIGDIRVAQKTLKRLSDRIENAQHTFVVDSKAQFKTTLIIDDAIGSGASMNQIAGKLKHANNTRKVIGFAITGSLNDFEVISEV